MQLTIKTFPKYRPNITLHQISDWIELESISYEPSNKEIRLAIELAKLKAPLRLDLEDTVRSILQCNISNEKINAVKSFKQILYEKVIVCENGKHKIVKVLRRRNFKNNPI